MGALLPPALSQVKAQPAAFVDALGLGNTSADAAAATAAATTATTKAGQAASSAADAATASAALLAAVIDAPPTGDVPPVAETLEALDGTVLRQVYADGTVITPGLVTEIQADGTTRLHPGTTTGGITLGVDGVPVLGTVTIGGITSDTVADVEGVLEYTGTSDGYVLSYTTNDGAIVSLSSLPVPTDAVTNFPSATIGGVSTTSGSTIEGMLETREIGPDGYVIQYIADDGSTIGTFNAEQGGSSSGGSSSGFAASDITSYDAAARDYSLSLLGTESGASLLTYQLLVFQLYGQSLSDGTQGFPSLSRVPAFGSNYMNGQSIHSSTINTWSPIGGTDVLTPLRATVYDNAGGVLSDAGEAALIPTNTNRGETVGEGAMKFLKQALSDRLQVAEATDRRFLLFSCGVGGKSVEELSKNGTDAQGAVTGFYPRLTAAATRGKSLATAGGFTSGAAALIYNQGERNYDETYGCTILKAPYKTFLRQLFADWRADVPVGIFGQSAARPAPIFMYQTSGPSVTDVNRLAISQGQLEMSNEDQFLYLYALAYGVPAAAGGVHRTSNGYRWLGNHLGKVMARVLLRGDRWKPVQPIRQVFTGSEVLLAFHVPVAPLVLDTPYSSTTPAVVPNAGLSVYDDNGSKGITTVEVVAPRVIRLKLSSPLDIALNPRVRGGSQTVTGRLGICDSDPAKAVDTYDYTAGSGQDPSENVAALVGKPYDLRNWCALFDLPIVKAS